MVCAPSKDARLLASKGAFEVQTKWEEEKELSSTGQTSSVVTCKDWTTGQVTAKTVRSGGS